MFFASWRGSPVAFHADEHFGGSANQLLAAELNQELVGAGVGALHPLEKIGSLAGVRRLEGLAQHHFVVIAAAHAFADGFHVGLVFFNGVIGSDGAGRTFRGFRHGFGGAGQAPRGQAVLLEIVGEAFDDFPFAVHVDDFVAEEELQVFPHAAFETQGNGLKLVDQVEAEGAGEGEFVVVIVAEFVRQGAQHGEDGGLLAALFFGKEFRHRLQAAFDDAVLFAEIVPVRMVPQGVREQLVDDDAAFVERPEGHVSLEADQLQRRANGYNIPT